MISIQLNGKPRDLDTELSVGALLDLLGVNRAIVAVDVSGHIVGREEFDATVIRAGDAVEVVRMIGGG